MDGMDAFLAANPEKAQSLLQVIEQGRQEGLWYTNLLTSINLTKTLHDR
jgi:hypothetical protein